METHDLDAVADELAIRKVNAQYFHAVDDGDSDAYLAVWAPDGVSTGDNGSSTGHDELRDGFERMQETMSRNKRHVVGNLIIDIDGEAARQRCYLVVFERQDSAAVVATATYEDELRKTSTGWKFSQRSISVDPSFSPNR